MTQKSCIVAMHYTLYGALLEYIKLCAHYFTMCYLRRNLCNRTANRLNTEHAKIYWKIHQHRHSHNKPSGWRTDVSILFHVHCIKINVWNIAMFMWDIMKFDIVIMCRCEYWADRSFFTHHQTNASGKHIIITIESENVALYCNSTNCMNKPNQK